MKLYNLLIANELGIFDNKNNSDNINSAIQDFVNLAKNNIDIDDREVQESVFFYNDIRNLSEAEECYIKTEVWRKLYGF